MNPYGPTATFIFGSSLVAAMLVTFALLVKAIVGVVPGFLGPEHLRYALWILWAIVMAEFVWVNRDQLAKK